MTMFYSYRFILIKYADRGLVKNDGKVSNLFDQLYATLTGAFNLFFVATLLSNHFSSNVPYFIKICMGETVANESSYKAPTLIMGFSLTIAVSTGLLFYFSKRFVSGKSQNKSKLPVIFGRYQRNVVTFKQTIVFNSVIMSLMVFQLFLMYDKDSHDLAIMFPLSTDLFASLFDIYLIIKIESKFSKPRSKNKVSQQRSFYVRQQEMVPRKDSIIATEPPAVPRHKTLVIFVKAHQDKE